jgi:hypothetical protein
VAVHPIWVVKTHVPAMEPAENGVLALRKLASEQHAPLGQGDGLQTLTLPCQYVPHAQPEAPVEVAVQAPVVVSQHTPMHGAGEQGT